MLRLLNIVLLASLCLISIGCGGQPSATANGEVKYAGKLVENGSIVFQAYGESGGGSAKALITGGKYSLDEESGLTAGHFRVQIYGYQRSAAPPAGDGPGAETIDDPDLAITENAGPPIEGDPNTTSYIPSKYNLTTELKVEIKAGENPGTNFDLQAARETLPPE